MELKEWVKELCAMSRRHSATLLSVVAVILLCSMPARFARAQCGGWLAGDPLAGFDGPVYASVEWDQDGAGPLPPLLVVGGDFRIAGDFYANGIAAWDGQAWRPLGSGVDGWINALCVYRGELIAAGDFTTIGGVPAHGIARWNGVNWAPLGGGVSSTRYYNVRALTVHDGELIVAGRFDTAGGVSTSNVAKWDGTSWSALGDGVGDGTYSSADCAVFYNDELFVAGYFEHLDGTPTWYSARWDGTSWTEPGSGLYGTTAALVIQDGQLYSGGEYYSRDTGDLIESMERWDGNDWVGSGVSGVAIDCLITVGTDLVGVGSFSYDDINMDSSLARWTGDTWEPMSDIGAFYGYFAGTYRGKLVDFSYFGSPLSNLQSHGAFVWGGERWELLGAGLDEYPSLFSVYAGGLVCGGSYQSIGTVHSSGMAMWDGLGWQGMDGVGGYVLDALPWKDVLVAVGLFSTKYGGAGEHIAYWTGGEWVGFHPPTYGYDQLVSLYDWGGTLLVGGDLYASDGAAKGMARWDGTEWRPMGSGLLGTVYTFSEYGGSLIAGGWFDLRGDHAPANNIVRWDGTEWQTVGGGMPAGQGGVESLVTFNGELIAAGPFTQAGSVPCNHIARWDGASWKPFGSGISNNESDRIKALIVYHGRLIVAGQFTSIDGVSANNIASWDGAAWHALGSGVDSDVVCLGVFKDELVVGGSFMHAGGKISGFWARWSDTGAPWVARQPAATIVPQGLNTSFQVTPANGFSGLAYRWRRDGQPVSDGPGGASAGGGFVSGATGATLTISGVQFSDGGQFDCVVSNACGTDTSGAAALTVVCLADFDLNGFVNGDDADAFYLAFFEGDTSADVDRNGFVNGDDADAFGLAFFNGC